MMIYLYLEECDNHISDESLKRKKIDRCDLKKKQNISPDCIINMSVLEWGGAVTLF